MADGNLFTAALTDQGHVLNPLLHSVKTLPYSLDPREHDRIRPTGGQLDEGNVFNKNAS